MNAYYKCQYKKFSTCTVGRRKFIQSTYHLQQTELRQHNSMLPLAKKD